MNQESAALTVTRNVKILTPENVAALQDERVRRKYFVAIVGESLLRPKDFFVGQLRQDCRLTPPTPHNSRFVAVNRRIVPANFQRGIGNRQR